MRGIWDHVLTSSLLHYEVTVSARDRYKKRCPYLGSLYDMDEIHTYIDGSMDANEDIPYRSDDDLEKPRDSMCRTTTRRPHETAFPETRRVR